MKQVSPLELKSRRDRGESIALLDVRNPDEYHFVNLGGTHIPLPELSQRWHELDGSQEWIVLCHHGVRSAHAAAFLNSHGVVAANLSGGIDRYAEIADPSIKRY